MKLSAKSMRARWRVTPGRTANALKSLKSLVLLFCSTRVSQTLRADPTRGDAVGYRDGAKPFLLPNLTFY